MSASRVTVYPLSKICDPNHHFVNSETRPSAQAVFGYRGDDVCGCSVLSVCGPESDRKGMRQVIQSQRSSSPSSSRVLCYTRSGAPLWYAPYRLLQKHYIGCRKGWTSKESAKYWKRLMNFWDFLQPLHLPWSSRMSSGKLLGRLLGCCPLTVS